MGWGGGSGQCGQAPGHELVHELDPTWHWGLVMVSGRMIRLTQVKLPPQSLVQSPLKDTE